MSVYAFDEHELDVARRELRARGDVVPIEPQAFDTLRLLVEARARVVSKDELIETVWSGRIVSDAAIASQIKAARKALGDDGRTQRYIKTVHGRGFRFVGSAQERAPSAAAEPAAAPAERVDLAPTATRIGAGRPSIAVLPFRVIGDGGAYAAIADALPQDLTAELSRLHWLFVIARGSSFRFRDPAQDVVEIGARLGARYCVSGGVEILGRRMTVHWELTDALDGGVVWAERAQGPVERVHELRAETTAKIVSALELRISAHEVERARLSAPDNLDVWARYHLGLHHLFRFTKEDNARALTHFAAASSEDPSFARAYAGLSFAQFQDSFLRYKDDVDAACAAARRSAERGCELDPLDPFVNLALGRAIYLGGDLEGGRVWLDRAIELCPSHAQAIYSRGWVDVVLGRGAQSQAGADEAMALSPLDPLRYAMLGVRSISHLGRDQIEESVVWAERSARSPGAHELVMIIAAVAHGIAGDEAKARRWVEAAKRRNPTLTQDDYFRAFPFRDEALRRRSAEALRRAGLD